MSKPDKPATTHLTIGSTEAGRLDVLRGVEKHTREELAKRPEDVVAVMVVVVRRGSRNVWTSSVCHGREAWTDLVAATSGLLRKIGEGLARGAEMQGRGERGN